MIEFVVSILGLLFFAYVMCYIINKFMGEEEMNIYVVLCNGKLSSEGYETLEQAQKFCETRNEIKQKIGNGWRYEGEHNSYVIQEVRVVK